MALGGAMLFNILAKTMLLHKEMTQLKGTDIRKKIMKFLKEQEWPVTTENVAAAAGVSWNTAQVHLLKLMAEGKVKYRKVGRQNQFWLNKKYAKEMARELGEH